MDIQYIRLVPSKSDNPANRGDWHINLETEEGVSLEETLGVVTSPTEPAINLQISGTGWEVFRYVGDNRFQIKPID